VLNKFQIIQPIKGNEIIVIKIHNSCYGGHRDCPLRAPKFVATGCEWKKMK